MDRHYRRLVDDLRVFPAGGENAAESFNGRFVLGLAGHDDDRCFYVVDLWLFCGKPVGFYRECHHFFFFAGAAVGKNIRGARALAQAQEYVVKERKVEKCFGCGQCGKGGPLIVEYREKIDILMTDSGSDGRSAG